MRKIVILVVLFVLGLVASAPAMAHGEGGEEVRTWYCKWYKVNDQYFGLVNYTEDEKTEHSGDFYFTAPPCQEDQEPEEPVEPETRTREICGNEGFIVRITEELKNGSWQEISREVTEVECGDETTPKPECPEVECVPVLQEVQPVVCITHLAAPIESLTHNGQNVSFSQVVNGSEVKITLHDSHLKNELMTALLKNGDYIDIQFMDGFAVVFSDWEQSNCYRIDPEPQPQTEEGQQFFGAVGKIEYDCP